MSFPRYKYHAEHAPVVIATEEEDSLLGDGWTNSPADHGTISAPSVEQARRMELDALNEPEELTPAQKRAATLAAKKVAEKQ